MDMLGANVIPLARFTKHDGPDVSEGDTGMTPDVTAFFHDDTCTIAYVVREPDGGHCAIVDPVLDYDPVSGRTTTTAADVLIEFVRKRGLALDWILETHAHADHLTAAPYLKKELGGLIAIGARITDVQATFKTIFNLENSFVVDGSQFDRLLADDEDFEVGRLRAKALQ